MDSRRYRRLRLYREDLGGLFLGQAFGFDVFALSYTNNSMVGIGLCGVGGRLSLKLTRWAIRLTHANTKK